MPIYQQEEIHTTVTLSNNLAATPLTYFLSLSLSLLSADLLGFLFEKTLNIEFGSWISKLVRKLVFVFVGGIWFVVVVVVVDFLIIYVKGKGIIRIIGN
jgi:hypothetical protein